MKNDKTIYYDKKRGIQLNLDVFDNDKNTKTINLYFPKSKEEITQALNSKFLQIRLTEIENYLEEILNDLDCCNTKYSELYHNTQLWEKGECYEFDFKNWNIIKRVKGRLTRYYNDLMAVKLDVERRLKK